jgi:hypothetical protein
VLATALAVGTSGGTNSSTVHAPDAEPGSRPGTDGAAAAGPTQQQAPHASQTFDLDGREVRVTLSKDEF